MALTPNTVTKLIAAGHAVIVDSHAVPHGDIVPSTPQTSTYASGSPATRDRRPRRDATLVVWSDFARRRALLSALVQALQSSRAGRDARVVNRRGRRRFCWLPEDRNLRQAVYGDAGF